MNIAVDYDNTWTANPSFFEALVALGENHGMAFVIVTNRAASRPVGYVRNLPVVYCDGQPKRHVCRLAGYAIDIWIDDLPHLVDLGTGHPLAAQWGLP